MDLVLRELRGKLGLVILSAWGPSIEAAAPEWGAGLPFGTVGTDHARVGEIQGRQVRAFLPSGRAGALRRRPAALLGRAAAARRPQVAGRARASRSQEISAGQWTESDGIVAFNDWYRVAKARDPIVHGRGRGQRRARARRAARVRGARQRRAPRALLKARFIGVDACPTFGQRLVAEKQLAASVFTPANTGLALAHLHRFWTQGTPVPLRSFTEARPWPPGSAGS